MISLRQTVLWGTLAIALCVGGCAPTLHQVQTPPNLTFERPEWLTESAYQCLLDGEVVLDEKQNFDDLQVGRTMVIVPLSLDAFWTWIRDPRVNPHFVDRITEYELLRGPADREGSVWLYDLDFGPLSAEVALRIEQDLETRTVRYVLEPDPRNEMRELSFFIRAEPVSDPDYCALTIGAYVVSGWWWVPGAVEGQVLRNTLTGIGDEIRQNIIPRRERMEGMTPTQWFESGLYLAEGRQD